MPAAPPPHTLPADATSVRSLLLQKISNDADLPALGKTVSRVVQLTSSDDEAVRNLTYFILSDVALTQKILRLSNTVFYRSTFSTPVTTISRAIYLLGFDTIKNSALAMILVDRLTDRKHAKNVHAKLLQALCASVVGREMAKRSHYHGGEEAAIAALFKNLGELLIASHDHALYSDILALTGSHGLTLQQASMLKLGCSLDLLAESVLKEWQFPDTIIRALAPLATGVQKPPKNRQEWMQLVASFSMEASLLLPHMEGADDSVGRALLSRYGSALHLDQEQLDCLFSTVTQEIKLLADSMNLPPAATIAAFTPSAASAPHGLPAEFLLSAADVEPQLMDARHASGKPMKARELLLTGVQDVTQMMASGNYKVNQLILLVLETLYSSLGFRFATLCIKAPKSHQFSARLTIGEDSAARQTGFTFPIASSKDLFHLALENDADVMIGDASTAKIQDLLPDWHKKLLPDARSFILLPLVVQKVPLGLFYADRKQDAPEGIPPDEAALIKTLKGQVLAALQPR
jgi:HD-like signal output (HDOD) protein